MNILTIIPIAKGIPRDELSYFSAKSVSLGTLVTVPFGGRTIKGVVIDQQPVRDLKSTIKTSSFALRNITTIHHDQALPAVLFSAGQKTARFFAQPVGPVIKTMIPDMLFDYYTEHSVPLEKTSTHPNIQTIQAPSLERISMYKTMIRENLAKQKSTMVVVPSIVHAEHHARELGFGITDALVVMHSKKTKKQVAKNLDQIFDTKKPIVLITTPPYASIIRNDWDTMIIDESGSSYYHYQFSPVFHMKFFLETLGASLGARIILGDNLLDTETHAQLHERRIFDMRTVWHTQKPKSFSIIDMKSSPTLSVTDFDILDNNTLELLRQAQEKNISSVLLTARKGLAPLTVCRDCGATVSCPKCTTPLVLRKKNRTTEARIYMCHACHYMTDPIDHCMQCMGWKLHPLGISTDILAEHVQKKFPDVQVFICDGDTTKTPSAISKTITNWKNNPGSILVITAPIIPYLETIPVGCIVSIDSLLSLPTLHGHYHALRTCLQFLEKIEHVGIIQTRNYAHEIIQVLEHDTIHTWMKHDLQTRDQLHYPPFYVLIKISVSVSNDQVSVASNYFADIFKNYSHDIMTKKTSPEDFLISALVRIPVKDWQDPEYPLHEIVQGLGSGFVCEVNPERII